MKTVLGKIQALEKRVAGYDAKGSLKCDMKKECDAPVSYIDEKGYIYCEYHGKQRAYSMRCRKLSQAELKQLESGKPLSEF